jgi:hypothetical protein
MTRRAARGRPMQGNYGIQSRLHLGRKWRTEILVNAVHPGGAWNIAAGKLHPNSRQIVREGGSFRRCLGRRQRLIVLGQLSRWKGGCYPQESGQTCESMLHCNLLKFPSRPQRAWSFSYITADEFVDGQQSKRTALAHSRDKQHTKSTIEFPFSAPSSKIGS